MLASLSGIVARLRAAGCVFAEDEARLLADAARNPADLDAMVSRRVEGEPLEVIVGWVDFRGLRIAVDAGVFVPRQRSAFVVQQAIELARPRAVVVDLCCGAGALGAAIAAARADLLELHASDIDPAAVRCACRNLEKFGGQVHMGDLYAPLPAALRGRVDILVVNAPYVPTDEIEMMPPEARDYEPREALDGGPDGVQVHRRVAAGAPEWLAPGGHLLIETSKHQATLTADAMSGHGLQTRVTASEELYCTVAIGTKAAR
jgi:release factor glutamine methyltransferase